MPTRWLLTALFSGMAACVSAAHAADPVVQLISTTANGATVAVTAGGVTQTVTLAVGETALVAEQTVSLAFVAADKAVLTVNGIASTVSFSAGAVAATAGGLLGLAPTAAAVAAAAALAATAQTSETAITHSTATHHP